MTFTLLFCNFSEKLFALLRKNNIFYLFIFYFLLLSHFLFPQSEQYKFRRITANDGLSAPSVYSIIKDNQGLIWLATGSGLYRYDGYDFKYYRSDPNDSTSLSGNLLTAQLFVDDSGDLWVGTKDNGLNRFNISKETCDQFIHNPANPASISHNSIHKIIQDKSGTIWVATMGGGLNKFDNVKHSFSAFLPNHDDASGTATFIQSLIEFDDERLLVGTKKGLYLFNKSTNTFSSFYVGYNDTDDLREEIITDIIKDDEILWIGTENGLIKYNVKNEKVTRFHSDENDNTSLSSNNISQIVESPDRKSLWISTVWGLNHFDKKNGKIKRFLYNSDDPNSLGYNMLWGMYIDSSNLLWIGTDNAGVNMLNLIKSPFHHNKIGGCSPDKVQFSATVFYEDKKGDFWIGTFDGGLWQYDTDMKLKGHYFHYQRASDSVSHKSVFSLYEDSEENLWIGTSNGGVNKLNKQGLSSLIIETGKSHKTLTSVIEIAEDQNGVIWLGTLTGLYKYDKTTGKGIENIEVKPLSDALIRSICTDHNGNLWIGTHSEGLFKLEKKNRKQLQFKNFINDPDEPNSINSNIVMSIYEDCNKNIWIATSQGLNRYIPDQDQFESFDKRTGLEADYLYHVQGEDKGALWITISNGLIRFDPKADSNKRSRMFEFQQDVPFENIYPYSFYVRKNGEICVGGKYGSDYGYYTFHPDSLRDNTLIPQITITSILIKNETLQTDSAIIAKRKLILKHDQNFLSFEFAALDYIDPEKNQYAYYLEGLEDSWNYLGNRRFANYTAVPPGDYVFRIKGSNNDGYWNESGTSVAITILPPYWKTWWAYLIYVLAFFGILFSIFYYYFRRQQLLNEFKHLEEEKKVLAAMSLIEGQENERKRVAKELHDGLGVLLSAAKIQVSAIKHENPDNKSLIYKATGLLEQAIGDVRKISHNMMPGLLTKFGMFEAVGDLIDKINEAEELSASCRVSGPKDRLPENTEIMIYRIIQEMINNTLKHARATTIIIDIQVLPNLLDVSYSDDGIGFDIDVKVTQKSIGLQSILSRLNFLDGKLNFESKKGESAVFHMKIPI